MNEADTCRKQVVPLLHAPARKVPAAELVAGHSNLDRKNLRAKKDIAHLPRKQIAANILEKEQRIAEIMGRIQNLLARSADS